jgi:hypothetical protein
LAFLAVDLPVGIDLDAPRLHRIRHFADEIDLKQAVCKGRLLHLDMIGEARIAQGPAGAGASLPPAGSRQGHL